MTFRPLGSRVLVRYLARDAKTKSGLHIPDPEKYDPRSNEPRVALVVAVGPGHQLENGKRFPMSLQAGDIVLVNAHAHTVAPIMVDGLLHHVVDEWNDDGGEVYAVTGSVYDGEE